MKFRMTGAQFRMTEAMFKTTGTRFVSTFQCLSENGRGKRCSCIRSIKTFLPSRP